jgi:hypothetical protein
MKITMDGLNSWAGYNAYAIQCRVLKYSLWQIFGKMCNFIRNFCHVSCVHVMCTDVTNTGDVCLHVSSRESLDEFAWRLYMNPTPQESTQKSYTPISNSSVRIAMGYRLDVRGLIPGRGKRFLSTPPYPERLWVPPSLSIIPRTLSAGLKRSGREADHSPPSSTEVKNGGATPPVSHTSSWRGA